MCDGADRGFYSGCQKLFKALQEEIKADRLKASLSIMPGHIFCLLPGIQHRRELSGAENSVPDAKRMSCGGGRRIVYLYDNEPGCESGLNLQL